MKRNTGKRAVVLLLLFVILLSLFVGCAAPGAQTQQAQESGAPEEKIAYAEFKPDLVKYPFYTVVDFGDFNGKNIGAITGEVFNDSYAAQFFPEAKMHYFNSNADALAALKAGKIDAFLSDQAVLHLMAKENPDYLISQNILYSDNAFIFEKDSPKAAALCGQINEFLKKTTKSGEMQKILDVWFGDDDSKKVVDDSRLTGENGTLTMGVSSAAGEPFTYVDGGKYVGIEIDVATRFCREYGYKLEFFDAGFDALLIAASTGKIDFGGSGVTVSDERKESILFSDPIYKNGIALMFPDRSIASTQGDDISATYNGTSVGVLTGSVFDGAAQKYYPSCSVRYYGTIAESVEELRAGKINACVLDEPIGVYYKNKYPELAITTIYDESSYGFVFEKGTESSTALCEQFNEFIADCKADGTLANLNSLWTGSAEPPQFVDYENLTGENGTLKMGVSTAVGVPTAYMQNGAFVGYEVDLATRFCKKYGYGLEIYDYPFDKMLAAAVVGDVDFAASCIYATELREKSLLFSDEIYHGGTVGLYRKSDGNPDPAEKAEQTAPDYTGKGIGVLTGSIYDKVARDTFPNATISYFNSYSDGLAALTAKKVDAIIANEAVARVIKKENNQIISDRKIIDDAYAYIFKKDDPKAAELCRKMNDFLAEIRKDGTMQKIDEIWFGADESRQVVDTSGLTGENGTLKMGVSSSMGAPFCYVKDGKYVGYDVDIAVRFCEKYGYKLEFEDSTFDALLVATSTGKTDFAGACISITLERQQSVLFSDPNYYGGAVMLKLADTTDGMAIPKYRDLLELRGKTFGSVAGSAYDLLTKEIAPDSPILYYNSNSDMVAALETGKIDAFIADEPLARVMCLEHPSVTIMQSVRKEQYGFLFHKTSESSTKLLNQFNAFLAECKADGTMQELDDIWFSTDESKQTIDYSVLTPKNGTLKLGVYSPIGKPFCYYNKERQIIGYEPDLVMRFCKKYGYGLEISDSTLDGLTAGVATEKLDFGCCCLSITEERRESFRFSDPHYVGGCVIMVESAGTAAGKTFFESIAESFEKTFIRDNRWTMFISGILVTLIIAVCSTALGTILGFFVYLLCRKGNKIANGITGVVCDILQKTPIIVILMVLYYIIFGKLTVSGIWVSVVAFSLIMAASVIGLLKMGVGAIDPGQREAALALGYTDRQAFYKIIFPQAAEHVLPGYKGEIVSLLKGTSVVGYIAVQDLTKISDIIRSRTYEAFFPLIATAIIYFGLAWLITFAVEKIQIKVNPRRRKADAILKGVEKK